MANSTDQLCSENDVYVILAVKGGTYAIVQCPKPQGVISQVHLH